MCSSDSEPLYSTAADVTVPMWGLWLGCHVAFFPNFTVWANWRGCSASRGLWFAEQSCISAGSVCDSLMGPVNSNTQTRTTLMQHDPTLPAACTQNHELSYTEEQRTREKSPFTLWCWVKRKHFIYPIVLACVFPLKTLSSHDFPSCWCHFTNRL